MRVTGILCGLALGLYSVAPAYAQAKCGSAVDFENALTALGEVQVGGGIVNDKAVLVIYATPGGETWTVLTLGIDGSACLLMSGKEWFGGLPPLPVPGQRDS
jgi:hypothetical protein